MPDEATSRSTRKPGESPETDAKNQKRSYSPDPHRLLPQSPDAEKGVLSSFLISPREVGGLCAEKQVSKEYFFIPSHALIYETLLAMWDRNEPIDFITLTQILRDRNQLDASGGAAFITELFTFLPTAANSGYYIDIGASELIIDGSIKLKSGSDVKEITEDAVVLKDGNGLAEVVGFGGAAA